MTRIQIALYGDDADRFERYKEEIAERRDGVEPSNPEVLRVIMTECEIEPAATVGGR